MQRITPSSAHDGKTSLYHWSEINKTHIDIKASINNDTHIKECDVIINPYPNFNGGLEKKKT